ncbi:hypothetical protein C8J57DRAFT_72796 [Mycena rebaudengoi]|nr:hypothetical protein C8J57DRAFT_72796 [Mycena rebaudengoi]
MQRPPPATRLPMTRNARGIAGPTFSPQLGVLRAQGPHYPSKSTPFLAPCVAPGPPLLPGLSITLMIPAGEARFPHSSPHGPMPRGFFLRIETFPCAPPSYDATSAAPRRLFPDIPYLHPRHHVAPPPRHPPACSSPTPEERWMWRAPVVLAACLRARCGDTADRPIRYHGKNWGGGSLNCYLLSHYCSVSPEILGVGSFICHDSPHSIPNR